MSHDLRPIPTKEQITLYALLHANAIAPEELRFRRKSIAEMIRMRDEEQAKEQA